MSIIGEFKAFVTKGNVIDLAVGVLIGASFGKIVEGFTKGIIQPLINLPGGNAEISLKLWIFDLGLVINALIGFLITAAVLFFVFVKPMNHFKRKEEAPAVPPAPPEDVLLLREIRDLLKNQVVSSAEAAPFRAAQK